MASSSEKGGYVSLHYFRSEYFWECFYLWLLALLEKLGLTGLLGGGLASEVLLAGDLLDLGRVDAGDIDLVRGGDNVAGVDAADWDAVDLEWASDEEDTLVKVVQEDDALATETASEEDEDGSWDEGCAWSGSTDGLADLEMESAFVSGANFDF